MLVLNSLSLFLCHSKHNFYIYELVRTKGKKWVEGSIVFDTSCHWLNSHFLRRVVWSVIQQYTSTSLWISFFFYSFTRFIKQQYFIDFPFLLEETILTLWLSLHPVCLSDCTYLRVMFVVVLCFNGLGLKDFWFVSSVGVIS